MDLARLIRLGRHIDYTNDVSYLGIALVPAFQTCYSLIGRFPPVNEVTCWFYLVARRAMDSKIRSRAQITPRIGIHPQSYGASGSIMEERLLGQTNRSPGKFGDGKQRSKQRSRRWWLENTHCFYSRQPIQPSLATGNTKFGPIRFRETYLSLSAPNPHYSGKLMD